MLDPMHIHPYDGPMAKQNTERHTPLRPLRIPDDEWEALGQLVGDRNRTQAVREYIRWRLRWPASKQPERAPEQIGGPGISSKSEEPPA
jgi:hypothetical protein